TIRRAEGVCQWVTPPSRRQRRELCATIHRSAPLQWRSYLHFSSDRKSATGVARSAESDDSTEDHLALVRHIPRADGPCAELVGPLAADVGEGLLPRRDGRAKHGLTVGARPFVRGHDRVERALEAWHHVAREQFVGASRRLTARPFMSAEQHA